MKKLILSLIICFSLIGSSFAQYSSQVEAYIGEIKLFAGNFPPTGWAFCNGQILNISSNTALFSILGTTYGGNGVSTFGLPDLRGRVPIHYGNSIPADGSPTIQLGEMYGFCNPKLNSSNLPFVQVPSSKFKTDSTGVSVVTLSPNVNINPYNQYQPSLGLNYIICLYGIYPSRQ